MLGINHTSVGNVLSQTEYEDDGSHDLAHGTSFPSNPSERDFYYRDDLHQQFYYNGSDWVGIGIPSGDVEESVHAATGSSSATWAPIRALVAETETEIIATTITPSNPDATVCAYAGVGATPYQTPPDTFSIRLYINNVLVDSVTVADSYEVDGDVALKGFQDGLPAESIDISLRTIRLAGTEDHALHLEGERIAAIAVTN